MNWKIFKDNITFYAFFFAVLLTLIGCIALCSKAQAKCYVHIIQQGDTLTKISEKYTGEDQHWKSIKLQNNVRSTKLKIGHKLDVYVPDEIDWEHACRNIISVRLGQLKIKRPEGFKNGIVQGIVLASDNILFLSPRKKVEMCRIALTTAIQESFCQFAIGGAGELGCYQFKADTVRLTGEWYTLHPMANATDKDIATWMLDSASSTEIFVLHFHEIHKRYGNLWSSWKRYNNGSESAAYASRAMERYWKIKKIIPVQCKNEDTSFGVW